MKKITLLALRFPTMNLGKTLAMTAVTGMIAGLAACGGNADAKPPTDPSSSAAPASPTDKNCCKGKNECKGKSGCKAGDNTSCAGQNSCKGKGTSCPKAS
jgi:hypothetical protein